MMKTYSQLTYKQRCQISILIKTGTSQQVIADLVGVSQSTISRELNKPSNLTNQMREKIDSNQGRHIYSEGLGAIEPVYGNINTTKGLGWFSLRGKSKLNAQWLMFCIIAWFVSLTSPRNAPLGYHGVSHLTSSHQI